MFQQFNEFLVWFDDLVWGVPLIVLILVVGWAWQAAAEKTRKRSEKKCQEQ